MGKPPSHCWDHRPRGSSDLRGVPSRLMSLGNRNPSSSQAPRVLASGLLARAREPMGHSAPPMTTFSDPPPPLASSLSPQGQLPRGRGFGDRVPHAPGGAARETGSHPASSPGAGTRGPPGGRRGKLSRRPGDRAAGAARAAPPSPGLLTSCPGRRSGGPRPPAPRTTSSRRAGTRSPAGGRRRARKGACPGCRADGFKCPAGRPAPLSCPRPAAPAPLHPPPCTLHSPGTRRPCGSGGARTVCPSSRRSSSGQAWTSYSFLRLASRLGTDGPRASAPALSGPLPAGEPTAGTPDRVGSRLRPVCPLLLCSAFPSAK